MATNSFEQGLCDLLGEETYRAYFTNYLNEPDHTPGGDQADDHAHEFNEFNELGGADYMDSVLLEASKQFEDSFLTTSSVTKPATNARFDTPKSEEEVQQVRKASIPKKTQTDTKYCMDIWKSWSAYRNSVVNNEQVNEDITTLDNHGIQYWMSRFVLKVRKKDGSEYPPNTLHHICCGILRHLGENGRPDIDFYKDPSFAEFRATLDGEMKRLQFLGIGSKKRQAEPLTEEEEEQLLQTGQLGEHSPHYLQPLTKPTESCWYLPRAIGHHTLHNTESRICRAAGIQGFKTNHSLRVTAATHLFQAGVDEQLIMERTGHHSTGWNASIQEIKCCTTRSYL